MRAAGGEEFASAARAGAGPGLPLEQPVDAGVLPLEQPAEVHALPVVEQPAGVGAQPLGQPAEVLPLGQRQPAGPLAVSG